MNFRSFREIKDSTRSEPVEEYTEANGDSGERGRKAYRVRDSQAVSAAGRMDRDGPPKERAGALQPGPAWREGIKNGTQVQHNDSGKTANQEDQPGQLGRGRVITY
jgi:hypothetical protein